MIFFQNFKILFINFWIHEKQLYGFTWAVSRSPLSPGRLCQPGSCVQLLISILNITPLQEGSLACHSVVIGSTIWLADIWENYCFIVFIASCPKTLQDKKRFKWILQIYTVSKQCLNKWKTCFGNYDILVTCWASLNLQNCRVG